MDLAIRHELQKAVELAAREKALIGIKSAGGNLTLLRFDLTCYETHLEGTDEDGGPITIPYSDIESVSVPE
jgi:hypothetical protein